MDPDGTVRSHIDFIVAVFTHYPHLRPIMRTMLEELSMRPNNPAPVPATITGIEPRAAAQAQPPATDLQQTPIRQDENSNQTPVGQPNPNPGLRQNTP